MRTGYIGPIENAIGKVKLWVVMDVRVMRVLRVVRVLSVVRGVRVVHTKVELSREP